MRTYHLYLLLKTIYEASPADELISAGLTPGQISKLTIEASREGYLVRGEQALSLTEIGLDQLKDLISRKDLITPKSSKWVKSQKKNQLHQKYKNGLYVP